jgi:hypothetical protein
MALLGEQTWSRVVLAESSLAADDRLGRTILTVNGFGVQCAR